MGRQLNFHQRYVLLLEPIQAPSGETIAWELLTRFTHRDGTVRQLPANDPHQPFIGMLAAEKWQLFLLQLEQIAALYQNGFSCITSLNIDSDIIHGILKNETVQQKLDRLPFLRLEISAFFTERYHARDRLLLQNLAAMTPALLWLDDFGAGSSTLSMLNSGIFEYVKTDKTFFQKYGEAYLFDTLLNHLNELCHGVIVQGVDTPIQRAALAGKKITGMQGDQWHRCNLFDFTESLIISHSAKPLRTQRDTATHYRHFL